MVVRAGFPVNQFRTVVSEDQPWLYGPLSDVYSVWLTPDSISTFNDGAPLTPSCMRPSINKLVLSSVIVQPDSTRP